jgi:hypothetical protein
VTPELAAILAAMAGGAARELLLYLERRQRRQGKKRTRATDYVQPVQIVPEGADYDRGP